MQHFVDGTHDPDWPGFDKDVHELTGGIPRAVMVALLGLDIVLRQNRTPDTVRPGNKSPFAEAFKAIGDAGVSSAAHRRQVLHQMFVAIRTTIPTNVFVPASASLAKQQYWLTMCYCALFNTPVALTTKAAVGWVHSLPLFGDIADDGQSIKLRLPGVAVRYIKDNYLSQHSQYLAELATLPNTIDVNAPGLFGKLSRLRFLTPAILRRHRIRWVLGDVGRGADDTAGVHDGTGADMFAVWCVCVCVLQTRRPRPPRLAAGVERQ